VSNVRAAVYSQAKPEEQPLPVPPAARPGAGADAPATPLAGGKAATGGRVSRRGGREALALIFEPLRERNGWRHLWLGNTGRGKTWASRRLIEVPGQLTLIHDDSKAYVEFEGVQYFESADHLLVQPYDQVKHFTVVGFRGDDRRGVVCEVEEVCALSTRWARIGAPIRVHIDEVSRAMSDTGKKLLAPSLRYGCTRGRTMGQSFSACAQEVKFAPVVMLSQASSVAMFQLETHDTNYLLERHNWDPRMLELVARLDVGDFVIRRPAIPWDGCVYRFER
jgi:hypothetical protein